MTTRFELLLVGFGHVAQRFVTLLEEQRTPLAREHGMAVRVIGIVTRRHGRDPLRQVFATLGAPNGATRSEKYRTTPRCQR